MRSGQIDLDQCKAGAWSEEEARPFLVRDGDLLIVRGNGSRNLVGRAGVVGRTSKAAAYPDTLIRARFKPDLAYLPFVAAVWNSPFVRQQIEKTARTTAGIYKINQKDLERLNVPSPDVASQKDRFSAWSVYDSILTEIDLAVSLADVRASRLRQAILAKAFSGQLVPQDPNDEPASVLLDRIRAERGSHKPKAAARRRAPAQLELTAQN